LDASWFEQLLEIQGLQLLPATNANGGTGEAPAAPQKTDFANAPQTVLMDSWHDPNTESGDSWIWMNVNGLFQ